MSCANKPACRQDSRLAALLLLVICVSAGSASSQEEVASPARGILSGRAADANGGYLVEMAVVIKGIDGSQTVYTDREGKYQISLKTGLYSIAAYRPGFCRYQRAPFAVGTREKTVIDLLMEVCSSHPPPFKNANVLPSRQTVPGLFVQVRYQQVPEEPRRWYFRRSPIYINQLMVSYDDYAIYADSVRRLKPNGAFEAEGNVILQHGGKVTYAKKVVVDFSMPEPVRPQR